MQLKFPDLTESFKVRSYFVATTWRIGVSEDCGTEERTDRFFKTMDSPYRRWLIFTIITLFETTEYLILY